MEIVFAIDRFNISKFHRIIFSNLMIIKNFVEFTFAIGVFEKKRMTNNKIAHPCIFFFFKKILENMKFSLQISQVRLKYINQFPQFSIYHPNFHHYHHHLHHYCVAWRDSNRHLMDE